VAIEKINIGTKPDGSINWLVRSTTDAPLLITGPILGTVTLPDGSVYDVTPDVIEVWPEAGHELAISDAIGARHEAEGHPGHDAANPFVHTPSSVSHDSDGLPSKDFADTLHDPDLPNAPADVVAHLTGA
jgi:hypothetical protein